MTIHEQTIAKISELPESLVQEVSNFIDFLLVKRDYARWQQWVRFHKSFELSESDMPDYLTNLENYEERLARGEIRW